MVILTYLAKHTGQFKPQGEDEELEALRWIIFDNQKVNGFLGPFRFLKNFAPKPGDPAVMAFMKGRIDGALAIVNKRLTGRQFLVSDKPTIADISMTGYLYYPAEEFGFDKRPSMNAFHQASCLVKRHELLDLEGVGPTDDCPCGSGHQFAACHGL